MRLFELGRLFEGDGTAALALEFLLSKDISKVDPWFSCTDQAIEDGTGISRKAMARVRNTLKDHGLIETSRRGLPAQMYYRINHDILEAIL